LRNIKIQEIWTTFHWKQIPKNRNQNKWRRQ